jgi:L-alanine-DL-glutamate epimerase-like enolase superfamily enzyme
MKPPIPSHPMNLTILPQNLAAATAVAAAALAAGTPSQAGQPVREQVTATLAPVTQTIESIEVFSVLVAAERRFSYGVYPNRWHLFIRFDAGGKSGWTELQLGPGAADTPVDKLASRLDWFGRLKGKTPGQALAFLHENRDKRRVADLEAAEIAVLDLAGRLLGRPAAEILTLADFAPVPGLYCILTDDPAQVEREARRSLEQNLRTHLKVKLYGDTPKDQAVIRTARRVMGPDAFIVGDVNMGYRREPSDQPVDEIATAMQALREAGLTACEDPAAMTGAQWADVQRRALPLQLVPDGPLRPAWKGRETLDPAMGMVFNMHPHCMGSMIETIELGRAIKRSGRKLMVGDASLVGPACPAWQQVAAGLHADWVEAIEKPQENDVFQRCLTRNPVARAADGRFEVRERLPGFGVDLDLAKLRQLAAGVLSL